MLAATKRGVTKGIAARVSLGMMAVVLIAGMAGCSSGPDSVVGAAGPGAAKRDAVVRKKISQVAPKSPFRLIGDGSTAFTGIQPKQPVAQRLAPGRKPPQFVVFSWDGAGEDSQKLFSHFREVGRKYHANMTYFLSGVYLLPEDKRKLYDPPKHKIGSSDIGFNDTEGIRNTITQVRGAWEDGDEIGTHFNGHFCGPEGGVGTWSVDQWKSEIDQAKSFVKSWKTNDPGLKGEKPLPFDYDKELIGGRTPCLEGQKNMVAAARTMGFRYDSSGVNDQVWPKKKDGIWDLSMQLVPVPGREFETLSMDYNFMFNQTGTTQGDSSRHAFWGKQMRDGLIQAFDRAYDGNRAPLIIGNHFESWNGGTYMRAVEETIATVCAKKDVRCVSFRQLADWLDAQDPATLAKLGTLDVGQAPAKGWVDFLGEAGKAGVESGRDSDVGDASDVDEASGVGETHAEFGADRTGR
ncbi:hypothetical protein ABZ826_28310 [Streptomyces sp. NPDC047515]|uniref:hypothetical protein n=1 Tax=Streptomyces sp. NPDC047515 TaxID=3155380 RepID=UPI0033CA537B